MNTRFFASRFVKIATSLFIVCYLVSSTLAEALTTGWYRVGPYGARINCFAAVGSTLYFGGGSYDGGDAVYQSTDNGATWSKVGTNLTSRQRYVKGLAATGDGRLVAFTVDPTYHNQRQAYLLRNDAIRGWVWDKIDTGLVNQGSYPWGGAVTDSDGDILLGGYGTVQRLTYDAVSAAWSWVTDLNGVDSQKVLAITKDGAGIVYLVTDQEKIFKRVGTDWEYVANFSNNPINAYNFISLGDQLYVSAGAKAYCSSNGGVSWSELAPVDPAFPLVAGTNCLYNGAQRSNDNGISWQSVSGVVGQVYCSIRFNGIDFLGTSQGIYTSTNGGGSWNWQSLNDVACYQAYKLSLLANNNFFVASENGVYRSSDKGITWNPITSRLAYDVIVVNATSELLVNEFLADKQKHRLVRYISSDGGVSWQLSDVPITEQSAGMVVFQDANHDIYVADQPMGTNGQARIRKSTNGGLEWVTISNGLPSRGVSAFTHSGTDLIIGTLGSGIYRFDSLQGKWVPLGSGISGTMQFVKDVVASPSGSVYVALYGNDNAGIYRLVSNTWTKIATPHAPTALIAVNDATLYYGLGNGQIYKTNDGGTNWTLDTSFNSAPKVNDLALSPDNYLYAATNLGVYDPPILFDHCAPIVTPSISSGSYNQQMELNFSLNEVGTVYANVYGELPSLADAVQGPILLGEGRHSISYNAVDIAGNKSSVHRLEIVIDQTAPSLITNLDSGSYVGPQIMEFASEEFDSTLRLWLDGKEEVHLLPFQLVVERDMTVQASVYDSVYNASPVLSWKFEIEPKLNDNCHHQDGCACDLCLADDCCMNKGPDSKPGKSGVSKQNSDTKGQVLGLVKLEKGKDSTIKFVDTLNHWAQQAIAELAAAGVIEGYPHSEAGSSFRPDAKINRGEFVTLVMRLVTESDNGADKSRFADDIPSWALPHVQRAVELNLINGYPDGSFRPEDTISRAEMAIVLGRLVHLLELDGTVDNDKLLQEQLPTWAEQEVNRVVALGLIKGYQDGTFRPEQGLTRAEMAVVIQRLLTL